MSRAYAWAFLVGLSCLSACREDGDPAGAGESAIGAAEPSPDDPATLPGQPTGHGDHPSAHDAGTVSANGLPCEVSAMLEGRCGLCHGVSPAYGAPISLVSRADLMAPSASNPSQTRLEAAIARSKDNARPMPPVPNERLKPEEITLLEKYLGEGMPEGTGSCGEGHDPVHPGGVSSELPAYPAAEECDVPMRLTAGGKNGPYQVPLEDDHYECFYFSVPKVDRLLGLGFKPIIDDERVLHHWLLYMTHDANLRDGSSERCAGVHAGAALVAGWAPGGPAYGLPPDVGLKMETGPDAVMILELHYNNVARHADAKDASGVEVCGTTKEKKNLAAIHWLGSENLLLTPGPNNATSTCTPEIKDKLTILSVTPHMHKLGRHAKMTIRRKSGQEEVLLDAPFDFANQVGFATPAELFPGDTITSTCTFENTTGGITTFGEGTSDEMCYLFTLAYPIGAMNTGGNLLGFGVPGENKCMR